MKLDVVKIKLYSLKESTHENENENGNENGNQRMFHTKLIQKLEAKW